MMICIFCSKVKHRLQFIRIFNFKTSVINCKLNCWVLYVLCVKNNTLINYHSEETETLKICQTKGEKMLRISECYEVGK